MSTSTRAWQRALADLAERHGGKTDFTHKHARILIPGCQTVFCAQTPSDHRALLNIRTDVRRVLANRRPTCTTT